MVIIELYNQAVQLMKWNWQQSDWPNFKYNSLNLQRREEEFLHRSGLFLGAYLHISESEKQTLTIELLSDEAVSTSEIEGEILDRDSVQYSLMKRFGLDILQRKIKSSESGIAEAMLDLYKTYAKPLDQQMLFSWHEMIMNGRNDIEYIGSYRKSEEPMQIVSGKIYDPTVHFEAPRSSQVPIEMKKFIGWFNDTAAEGKNPLPALTRSAMAHLYFESIHPFEDGNGRIGRAISEKVLSQSLRQPALIALSQTIQRDRKKYYEMLEKSNKSNQIDEWLDYFSGLIMQAQESNQKQVEFVIQKTKFYDKFRGALNERQDKAVTRIFREGIDGFKGGLSADNYLGITKTSRATATRDLTDLVEKGMFTKSGVGKGTRYHLKLDI